MQRAEALGRSRAWAISPLLSVLLVVVAAAALRWWHLGAKSFDLDEAFSVALAREPWASFFQSLASREGHMALYYVLLRAWRGLGESEAVLRTLSVLPAVATMPVLYALGARLFGARVALFATLLLCVNAFHVQYAQEARSYSLVMLLATTSTYFLVRSLEEPSGTGWWTAYIVTSVLCVYGHLYGALVLVSQWIALAARRQLGLPLRAVLTSIALIGVGLVPLATFVLTRATASSTWTAPRPRLTNILGVFYVLAGNTGRLAHPDMVGLALMAAYLGLCLRGILGASRTPAGAQGVGGSWRYSLLLSWLCLPVLLAFVIAVARPTTAPFWAFYLIVCLPPFVLLAAAGLDSIRPMPVLVIVLAVTLAFAGYETYRYDRYVQKEDFRDATHRLLSLAAPGDAVVFDAPYGHDGFDYYRDRFPGTPPIVVLPDWRDATSGYRRVWLVVNSGVDAHASQAGLAKAYSLAQEWTFPGIRLVLYKRVGVSGRYLLRDGQAIIIRTIPLPRRAISSERLDHFLRPEAIRPAFRKVG